MGQAVPLLWTQKGPVNQTGFWLLPRADSSGRFGKEGLLGSSGWKLSNFCPYAFTPYVLYTQKAKWIPAKGRPVFQDYYRRLRENVSCIRGKPKVPHHSHLEVSSHLVLPGEAENVWQVEGEVDDTTAGRGQAGLGKEGAEQEALHDRSRGESQQEQEEDERIAVVQDPSMLKPKRPSELVLSTHVQGTIPPRGQPQCHDSGSSEALYSRVISPTISRGCQISTGETHCCWIPLILQVPFSLGGQHIRLPISMSNHCVLSKQILGGKGEISLEQGRKILEHQQLQDTLSRWGTKKGGRRPSNKL